MILQIVFCSRSADRVCPRSFSLASVCVWGICDRYNYRFAPNGRRLDIVITFDSTTAEPWNRSLLSDFHVFLFLYVYTNCYFLLPVSFRNCRFCCSSWFTGLATPRSDCFMFIVQHTCSYCYYSLLRHWGSTYAVQSYTVDKTIKQKHHKSSLRNFQPV